MHLPEKIHLRETLTKKKCASKPPHAPHNFSNCPSLRSLSRKTVRGGCGEGLKEKVPSSIPSLFLVFFPLSYFIF